VAFKKQNAKKPKAGRKNQMAYGACNKLQLPRFQKPFKKAKAIKKRANVIYAK
jgi:hypothetical protein